MSICRSNRTLLFAAFLAAPLLALLPSRAAAQQITYYDFNGPQASSNPVQYSYSCTPGSSSNPLFCFNGSSGDPSFFSDFYPPFIDPNANSDEDSGSTNYALQMTPDTSGQVASLWFSVPQNVANGFSVWFAFKLTPDSILNPYSEDPSTTADGLAFVIQNSPPAAEAATDPATGGVQSGSGPTAFGSGGGNMGYSGINNSLALEFDTFTNSWDPNNNHIALQGCGPGLPNSANHYYPNTGEDPSPGACSVNLGGPDNTAVSTLITQPLTAYLDSETNQQDPVTLADGYVHQVVFVYNGPNEPQNPNQLQVFLDPEYNPGTHTPVTGSIPLFSGTFNIAGAVNLINGTNAYVGFTSATGGAFEQNELMAWTFTPHTTVTQQQPLQPPGSPTYQPFNFGTHTYGVQVPSDSPSTTGISMTVTANTVSPNLFSSLIGNTPFNGSVCQVYDDTGGNCIIYSVSCFVTGSNPQKPVACPAITSVPNCQGDNAASCFSIKTTYNSDIPPISPGFLQGDPFYSQISALTVDSSGNATFTCTGECSITEGQNGPTPPTVSVVGAVPAGFDGSYTVTSVLAPNSFMATTSVPPGTPTTPGFLTSPNVQNIFYSWQPQNIDGTSTGKGTSFSDFVFTTQTSYNGTQTQLSAVSSNPTFGVPDMLTATVTGYVGQTAPPAGNVLFYAGSTLLCTSPLNTVVNVSTATCSWTPNSASSTSLSAFYQGDSAHFPSNSNQLNLTPLAGNPAITFTPSPASQSYGTPIAPGSLNAAASYNSTPLLPTDGSISYTTTINGVPNQPVIAGSTILPAGNYTITATFKPAADNYISVSTAAPYVVNQVTPSVTWPTPSALVYGQTLSASSLTTGGSAISPVTSAAVPGSFVFASPSTAPPAGSSLQTVTFNPNDTNDFVSVTNNAVPVQVRPATPTVTFPTATAIVYGQPLSASTLGNTGSATNPYNGAVVTGTFTFVNPGALPTATGPQQVIFTPAASYAGEYAAVAGFVSVTVGPATLTVTPNPSAATMTYGGPVPTLTPSYSGFVNGVVVPVTNPPACTAGVTSTTSAGTHATSCSGGTAPANYVFSYATGSITINQAIPTITWATPAAITYGTALGSTQLNAKGSVPGMLTYSPASGVLTAGSQKLTVTLTPSDKTDYATVSASVYLTVNQAVPVITWATPAAINYPTALSATQLDAKATIPGTSTILSGNFTYLPALGTILSGGTQTLTATFTPSDTVDYTSPSATVKLVVNESTVTMGIASGTQVYQTWTNFVMGPSYSGSPVPTGTVTLYDNGVAVTTLPLLANGLAYWTTQPPFSVGANNLTVSYSGDAHHPGGLSAVVTLTVLPAPVLFQASCWGGTLPTTAFQCTTNVSASTTTQPAGNITYSLDGGAPVTVPIVKGNAPFSIAGPFKIGTHKVTLNYAAQGNFAAAGPLTETFVTQ